MISQGDIWLGALPDEKPRPYLVVTRQRAIDGLEVLHDCPGGDNKLCLRGEHLFIGTAKENAVDSIAKGQRTRHAQKRGPISRLDGRLEEIIDTCRANSMSQACKLLGVSDTQLRRWLKDRGICPSCLQGISHDQRANGSGVGRFIPTPCGRSLTERGRPLFISQHGG